MSSHGNTSSEYTSAIAFLSRLATGSTGGKAYHSCIDIGSYHSYSDHLYRQEGHPAPRSIQPASAFIEYHFSDRELTRHSISCFGLSKVYPSRRSCRRSLSSQSILGRSMIDIPGSTSSTFRVPIRSMLPHHFSEAHHDLQWRSVTHVTRIALSMLDFLCPIGCAYLHPSVCSMPTSLKEPHRTKNVTVSYIARCWRLPICGPFNTTDGHQTDPYNAEGILGDRR